MVHASKRDSINLILGIARVLAVWPKAHELYPNLQRVSGGRGARRQRPLGGHDFVWTGRVWTCRICIRSKRSRCSKIDYIKCNKVPAHFESLAEEPLGHSLFLTQVERTGTMGAFCRRCGAFCFGNIINLRKPCTKPRADELSKGTQYRLGRIRMGRHPFGKEPLTKPWPLRTHLFLFSPSTPHTSPQEDPSPGGVELPEEVAPQGLADSEEEEEIDLWAEAGGTVDCAYGAVADPT